MSYSTKKSHELLKKAKEVIPGGVFGHYKYAIRDTGPVFFLNLKVHIFGM